MAVVMLKVTDQTLTGEPLNEMILEFERTTVTLKEIISSRVELEVRKYNEKKTEYFNGLVQPSDAEVTLNGYKTRNRKKIDTEMQLYIALESFQKNGYFVLVDNHQVEKLDEEVQIAPQTQVSFIKLTPLIGG
jgi:hypothetical protein